MSDKGQRLGRLAGAYCNGYRDAAEDAVQSFGPCMLEMLADVERGLRTLDEIASDPRRCDPVALFGDLCIPWLPTEYDDLPPPEALCADCGKDTLQTEGIYMVRDDVWAAARMQAGFLHRACLEGRLGRPLTGEDYTEVPINRPFLDEFESDPPA